MKKKKKNWRGFLCPAYEFYMLSLSILYRGKSEDKQVSISLNLDFGNV